MKPPTLQEAQAARDAACHTLRECLARIGDFQTGDLLMLERDVHCAAFTYAAACSAVVFAEWRDALAADAPAALPSLCHETSAAPFAVTPDPKLSVLDATADALQGDRR